MKYKIDCAHSTHGVPVDTVLPDYHPLKPGELLNLLTVAAENKHDAYVFCDVQCRVVQAIPGVECPHRVTGPVFDIMVEIEYEFQSLQTGNIMGILAFIEERIEVLS